MKKLSIKILTLSLILGLNLLPISALSPSNQTLAIPAASFKIYVSCINSNNDGSLTAYFGYTNNLTISQNLDSSDVGGKQFTNVPHTLLAGTHDKAFSVQGANGTLIWNAVAGKIHLQASASTANSKCAIAPIIVPLAYGSITVCVSVINKNFNIVDGSILSGTKFTETGFLPGVYSPGKPKTVFGSATFQTPLKYNSDIFNKPGILDSQCIKFGNLEIGDYYYGQESLTNANWSTPLYNDQLSKTVQKVGDFFPYDPRLFANNGIDANNRNLNADGDIVLTTARPDRTLMILNQYNADDGTIKVDPPFTPAPPPVVIPPTPPTPPPVVTPPTPPTPPPVVIPPTPPAPPPVVIPPTPPVVIIPPTQLPDSYPVSMPILPVINNNTPSNPSSSDGNVVNTVTGNSLDLNKPTNLNTLTFVENQFKFSTKCTTRKINLNSGIINSTANIIAVEYSLDNGLNWYAVEQISGLGTKSTTISLETRSLKDKIYQFIFKAQTSDGSTYYSNTLPYILNCDNQIVLLGSYYENGVGTGVVNPEGDLIYNSTLPLNIYVETLGGVSSVNVKLTDEKTNLTNNISINLDYNSNTNLWSAIIPSELIEGSVSLVNITAKSQSGQVTRSAPKIISPDFLTATTKSSDYSEKYTYNLYFYAENNWHEINYQDINQLENYTANQKFTLYPGDYYIQVTYPNNQQLLTNIFSLVEPSVVQVNTTNNINLSNINFIAKLFSQLSVDIYSKNTINTKLADTNSGLLTTTNINSTTAQLVDISSNQNYQKLIKNDLGYIGKSKLVTMYWNRWNPHFAEELATIVNLQKEMNMNNVSNKLNFIIFTDTNNIEELTRALKITHADISIKIVTDDSFYNHELSYQPEYILFDPNNNSILSLKGAYNYSQLSNLLT